MNNSSFHEQSTNISDPSIDQTKLVPLEVETKEAYRKTTKYYKRTRKIKWNEQKKKQKLEKTCKQHKEKKEKNDIDNTT